LSVLGRCDCDRYMYMYNICKTVSVWVFWEIVQCSSIVSYARSFQLEQRMLTPPRQLILPSHLSEVSVALHSILELPLDYGYVLHIVNFTILYINKVRKQ
jgi:hypothetical protein